MDARMRKHRVVHWVGRFVAALQPGARGGATKKLGTPFIAALILAAFSTISFGETCLTVGGTYSVDYPRLKISITVPANLPVCNTVEEMSSVKLIKAEVTGCSFEYIVPEYIGRDYWVIEVSVLLPGGVPGGARFWIPVITTYDKYSISIEPEGSSLPINGTITILPSTALPLAAVVKNQNGVVQAGKQVAIAVNVQSGTNGVQNGNGGHIHQENRPKGKFACSSVYDPGSEAATCTLITASSGRAPFIFFPTAVSGVHTITATCNGCDNTATAPVNVKVDNLITIPSSPLYALSDSKGVIGAIPGKHTDNHYLTSTAITKLGELAGIYTTVNPGAKLYLNDASLTWGGLFDVGSTPWSSPHSLHDKGRSLDIRAANSGPNNEGSVPATLFKKFMKAAKENGFRIGLHCKNSSDTNYCLGQPNNRHFHVDF